MTDAPKIDTQAPERIWAHGNCMGKLGQPPKRFASSYHGTWETRTGDANYASEYILASLYAAREAAAWIAGRDALANHISAMMTRCAAANDKTYPSYAEDMRDWATDVTNEAGDLQPPADASAALDRLIAERVRESVDRVSKLFEGCASRLVPDDYAQGYREALEHVCDATRGSKEARDG